MKRIEIINKVYIAKRHSGKKRAFMKLTVCLCLVFIILSLIIGKGLTAAIAPVSLLLAINLGGLAAIKSRGEYQSVPCVISITDSQISIENQEIDRHNGLGICSETTIFDWLEIKTIHYSSVLNSVRFNGNGNRITCWRGAGEKERKKTQSISVDYIYFDNENRTVILDEIKTHSLSDIIMVD